MPGKTCVQCTFELLRFEHNDQGFPPGEHPTIEDCWTEICAVKQGRLKTRMSAHKKSLETVDANQKADKKAGSIHFDECSKRERRREEYKHLFGEHLISMCAAGNLFSTFTNFAPKMETLRQMTESAER